MATPKTVRTKSILDEIKAYALDKTLSMPRRIAHCLDWCAGVSPQQYVPFQLLLKAVMGYGKTPNMNSKEIEQLRRRWTSVRKILLSQYKRDLVIERGIGARATHGSEDVAKTTLVTRVRRFEGARRSVENTLAIVDPGKIQDRELRSWVGGLSPAFAQLESSDLVRKLLPPDAATKKKK